MPTPRDSIQQSCVPIAILVFALSAAAHVAATAGRIAALPGGGNVAACGQNQGGNGKREENQRAAGHVFLQGFLFIRRGPKRHRFQQAGPSQPQGRFCGGTVNLRFVTLFQ